MSRRVTRRELLGTTTAAALASALPARAEVKSGAYDVIILGAGFCGVTAARECARAGLRTLILEARGRIGGRTHTVDWNGATTELGGTWVHWTQPYVWAELERYGLALVESVGATAPVLTLRRSDGDLVEFDLAKRGEALLGAIAQYMGDSRAMFPRPHRPFDTGVAEQHDALNAAEPLARIADPLVRDFVDGFISASVANRAREGAWVEMVRWYALAGHNYFDLNDAVVRYRLRDGTKVLIDAMLADGGAELRLSERVVRVQQTGQHAAVTTESGEEIAARAVISTLPLNVLGDIAFAPALDPRKIEASRQRHAGACVKFHATIEGERTLAAVAPSDNAINWIFSDHAAHGKTHLIGFGPSAELLDIGDPTQVKRAVRALIPDANVLDSTGWIWTADEFARGTWCVLRPGQYSRHLAALQADAGRIVFASADWARGWRGFIDGAIEQGLGAARRARALLA